MLVAKDKNLLVITRSFLSSTIIFRDITCKIIRGLSILRPIEVILIVKLDNINKARVLNFNVFKYRDINLYLRLLI